MNKDALYKTRHPDRVKASQNKYYMSRRDIIKDKNNVYYQNNREAILLKRYEFCKNNNTPCPYCDKSFSQRYVSQHIARRHKNQKDELLSKNEQTDDGTQLYESR